MRREIIVENIIDGASRSYQKELGEMIRLDQSRVKKSGENNRQIGAEREHNGER